MSCLTAFAPSPDPTLFLRPLHFVIPLSQHFPGSLDGLCPLPRPHTVPTSTTLSDTFISTFSWIATLLAHTQKRQVGQGNHGSPSKRFCVNTTAVNCIRWRHDNVFAFLFKLREKDYYYAEIERKYTLSAFTCTFQTMTIMTDKRPRQLRR